MADDKDKQTLHSTSDDDEGRGTSTGSLYDASLDSKRNETVDDDSDTGSSGGGKTGAIEFRFQDGMAGLRRDDLLAPNEMNRLMLVHENMHKARVEKQRITRQDRAAKKEGRFVAQPESRNRHGLGGGGGGGSSKFKKHPISNMAQFSGIDKQVVGVPSLNEAETNAEMKDTLENRLENKYRNTPRFNPRPRPG
jgi:hypothetical protein